ESLACCEPERAVRKIARDPVERQPLRWRHDTARDAYPHHEGECLFELLLRALAAQVTIVLQIGPVKFNELLVVLGERPSGLRRKAVGDGTAELAARLLDVLVA